MKRGRRTPSPEVAAAFAAVADELPLELVEPEVEARCVGVAFAFFQRTVDVEVDTRAPTPKVEAQAKDHVTQWESLAPQEFALQWRDFATDPYVGVGAGWVGTIDQAAVEEWLKSPQLAEAEKTHPTFSPRHVKITKYQLVSLGPGRAIAVYRVEEKYKNGKVSAGNTFAVLLRVRGKGWRIAVASKGTRHEKPIRKG